MSTGTGVATVGATEHSRRRARGGRSSVFSGRQTKGIGSEKAWPIWSFVTRAYTGAIDRDLSLDTMNAEIMSSGLCCKCDVQLEYGVVATSLSGVFPELRCKVDVDSGTGSLVGRGDAMVVEVTSSRSSEGASRDSGRNGDSEFVCLYYEKRQCGKSDLGVRSREASVFEASKRSSAETRCVDIMNVDLNALVTRFRLGSVRVLQ